MYSYGHTTADKLLVSNLELYDINKQDRPECSQDFMNSSRPQYAEYKPRKIYHLESSATQWAACTYKESPLTSRETLKCLGILFESGISLNNKEQVRSSKIK